MTENRVRLTPVGRGHYVAKNVAVRGSGFEPRNVDVLFVGNEHDGFAWWVMGEPERTFVRLSDVRNYFNNIWEQVR